jgi:hypothetical protein
MASRCYFITLPRFIKTSYWAKESVSCNTSILKNKMPFSQETKRTSLLFGQSWMFNQRAFVREGYRDVAEIGKVDRGDQ